jgi:hypothetical protein
MKKISKEHRLLDGTDLNSIDNTFKEIKHDNNNNFNRIDNTFKLIENKMNITFQSIKEELKHNRESSNIRLNSMEKSNDIRYYTLLVVISFFGILLSILKVLF